MELAYVCEWEKRPKSTHCPSIPLVCSWSCRNLVAFTTDLKSDDEDDKGEAYTPPTLQQSSVTTYVSHMIHIIDTEHPWDVYSISSGHTEVISCLEWDQSGSRLLSADGNGQIKCWSMADHLVNSWESLLSSSLDGDPIVALSWLHNGVKLALHVEMSGSTNFGEKFSRVKFSPSLTLFGGKPMEGWLAVTVSGLVTVSLLKPGGALLTASESLCRLRGRVALADIAFTGGGNIVVAATDGSSSSPVQFYKVVVSVVSEKCRIDTELLPSLFLRCTTDPLRREKYPAVTHLKFLTRENSEQVLLCASNQSGSIVECWSLRKEGLPVNNIFQHRSPVGKRPHRLNWIPLSAVGLTSDLPPLCPWRILTTTSDLERVSAVALPKLPISISNTDLKVASDTKFCPGLGERSARRSAVSVPRPRDLLHMMRVSPSMGQVLEMNTTLRHLLFLLEYCMVTGYDWWDVLLHVQPSMVHNLVEKLHEEYMRQNQALQQTLQADSAASRGSSEILQQTPLPVMPQCRCIMSASGSGYAYRGRRDPLDTRTHCVSSDIDKVMINLKTEEFVLDGPPLQSLQQLIQWVGDFVLYLLANLPNQVSPPQGSMVRPGFGFMRDGASLAMLREMLVMIRIWGLLKPGCLPTFTATSDNQDSMQLLFRLLTKLWLCSREDGPPQDPDECLIDECCLLPSQLLVPTMDWLPVNDGVIVKLQGKHPLRLQFGKASSLPGAGSTAPLEVFTRSPSSQKMDNLRCVHMGVCPTEESKACTRCGCVTMLRSPNKTNAMKQWEQRWIKNCLCGGLWRRIPATLS
uniref:Mediator of RNA polymerase II transcription subunit 16 n=1 Tax=Gasterosteus aculeatus TaxID=69293 RepID=G3PJC5_GASAC